MLSIPILIILLLCLQHPTISSSSSTYLPHSRVDRPAVIKPVLQADFPDPSLIEVDDTFYSFATRSRGINIQVASSPNFRDWRLVSNGTGQLDAMPRLPLWVSTSHPDTWAPDVVRVEDGRFLMYFSARYWDSRFHCVGAAYAHEILGPYAPLDEPVICDLESGGAIDAAGFVDPTPAENRRYIVYKVDGNAIGNGGVCGNSIEPLKSTALMLQQVEGDGVTTVGRPVKLLDHSGEQDEGIVEAPYLARAGDGTYALFFSSGCFHDEHYTVSYALSSSLVEPFERAETPLFKSRKSFVGMSGRDSPGGASVIMSGDSALMVFHAGVVGERGMWTTKLRIHGGKVDYQ